MKNDRLRNRRILLLAPDGQRRLEEAYAKRSRRRASFADHAEAYLRCLEDEGRLGDFALDGMNPFETLYAAKGHAAVGGTGKER